MEVIFGVSYSIIARKERAGHGWRAMWFLRNGKRNIPANITNYRAGGNATIGLCCFYGGPFEAAALSGTGLGSATKLRKERARLRA